MYDYIPDSANNLAPNMEPNWTNSNFTESTGTTTSVPMAMDYVQTVNTEAE